MTTEGTQLVLCRVHGESKTSLRHPWGATVSSATTKARIMAGDFSEAELSRFSLGPQIDLSIKYGL